MLEEEEKLAPSEDEEMEEEETGRFLKLFLDKIFRMINLWVAVYL